MKTTVSDHKPEADLNVVTDVEQKRFTFLFLERNSDESSSGFCFRKNLIKAEFHHFNDKSKLRYSTCTCYNMVIDLVPVRIDILIQREENVAVCCSPSTASRQHKEVEALTSSDWLDR